MVVVGSIPARTLILLPVLMLLACDRRSTATTAGRVSRVGDRLLVQISDLTPGDTNRIPVRVSDRGEIRLPLIGDLKVVGLTPAQIEKAVKKAYADPGIVHDVHPSVKFTDYREGHGEEVRQ